MFVVLIKRKMETLETRKTQFKNEIWKEIGETFETYSKQMLIEFTDYWFEISVRGKKMRFEKEKCFSISRRLKTWKNNSMNWNKGPVQKEEPLPNYFNKSFWQRVSSDRLAEYKNHLFRLGWKYVSSPGGTFWQDPTGKMTWL